jgi:L-amino acid N-acyltransferase YncA
MTLIRASLELDMASITSIYAHHVLTGTGTFEMDPPSQIEMGHRRADVLSRGLPYLVLEHAGQVAGFAYCNWFKPRPAYRFSAENSIYMSQDFSRKGLGKALLSELMTQSQRAGLRKLIAIIGDSSNEGSIGLHRECGFLPVGTLHDCGWKFDRWLDVVIMEKSLGQGSSAPAVN